MRDDFTAKTRRLVAERSAFRCSFPECDRTTIGPGSTTNEAASNGVAAHIFSAAAGGPRGRGGLSSEQLRSPTNAIWLCADHARLVDTNRGTKFPPATLQSYK